jgi:4-hydroxy-tetrahydrodipicolinate synthase
MEIFRGSGVALVTPFNEDMSINYNKLEELIEWHIENNTDALIIAGTTGEATTLTDEDQIEVVRKSVEFAKGRVPIIAGSGSNDTQHGIYLSKECEKAGATGLLVVTPYYNKTNRKGLIRYFTRIADSVNIPIILYNVPSRTGMEIPANVIKELSAHKNIVGLKEASGDISYLAEVARQCGDSISIYSGNDNIIVPVLSLGGVGVISVLGNVLPNETHDIVMNFLDGDVKSALDLQLKLNGFVSSLFIETNPIPVKEAMNILGHGVGGLREPLWEMENKNINILKEEMEKLKLI